MILSLFKLNPLGNLQTVKFSYFYFQNLTIQGTIDLIDTGLDEHMCVLCLLCLVSDFFVLLQLLFFTSPHKSFQLKYA